MLPNIAIGSCKFKNPIFTAAGTAGFGAELDAFFPLKEIGAVVTKSIGARPWKGNPPPRLFGTNGWMLNSVGLQGDGIRHFVDHDLPNLIATGASIVVSIWGRNVSDFVDVVCALGDFRSEIAAIEVNLSCPNQDDEIFAHDPVLSAEIIEACARFGIPVWAKLSPNTTKLIEVAKAVSWAGAEALTLINTLIGSSIDYRTGRPMLGTLRGGMSGRGLHPIAIRWVYETRQCLPDTAIVGTGGIFGVNDVVEMMMAGANAVQIGTACFADPRAPVKIWRQLAKWAKANNVADWADLAAAGHRL